MLKMVSAADCVDGHLEVDPWIPFIATWATGNHSGQQPLYWRASGRDGGEVEVKVDPADGALIEVIVIIEPPSSPSDGATLAFQGEVEEGVPVLDLSPWGRKVNPDYSTPEVGIVSSVEDMFYEKSDTIHRLVLAELPPERVLACGGLRVEISADGSLVAVEGREVAVDE